MRHRLLALALVALLPSTLPAQNESASAVIARAIRAYQDLDFDVAATLLRRALSSELSDSARVQALAYLGAAEHYRAQPDSAEAVFRRLVVLAPRFEPDTLVFPPEITRVYDDVRSRTKIAAPQFAVVDTVSHHAPTPAPPPPAPPPPPPPPLPPPPRRDTSGQVAPQERAAAHAGITATGGATVVTVRASSEAGGLPVASGTVPGMTASVRLRRFELGVRYMKGSLETRDLVEGAAALRFATTPWLSLHIGPQIRRYDMPSGDERWAMWQLGARAEVPIGGSGLRGHAALWRAVGLTVNVPPGSGSAQGGDLGATFDLPTGPFWFGLAYSFDHASVQSSSRSETVKMLTITAGLRKRQ